MADKVGIEINVETNASQAKKQLDDLANVAPKVEQSANNISQSYKGVTGSVRNASYQVTDFIVQVQGGISPIRAFSQQAPQLLAGFGMIGVYASLAAVAIGVIVESFNLFETSLAKLDRYSKLGAAGMDLIRDSQHKLGQESIKDLNEWAKSWKTASESVRNDMLRTLDLQIEFDKMQLSILKGREDIDRAIAKGTTRETFTGLLIQDTAKPEERLAAQKRIMEIDQIQNRLDMVQKRRDNPNAALVLTDSEIKSQEDLIKSIQAKINKINDEAKYIGISNAQKEAAIALDEMQVQKAKIGADAYKKLSEEMIAAIYARDKTKSELKIKEYALEQQKIIDQLEEEAFVLNRTTREQERANDAAALAIKIAKETIGMQPEQIKQYSETAWALYNIQQNLKDVNYEQRKTFEYGQRNFFKTYKEDLENVARDVEGAFSNAFKGIEDALVSMVTTGKMNFRSLTLSILSDIARIAIRQAIIRPLLGAVGGLFSGAVAPQGTYVAGDTTGMTSVYANGGIMTEFGNVPLRKYANGGVTNTPQMALFGEGSTPEAYVPLPDGRSIPVTMNGASGGTVNNISVSVNVSDNGSQTNITNDMNKLGLAISNAVKATIIKEQRNGGLLSGA